MRYSFVGMSRPMKAVNNILRNKIGDFRRRFPGEESPLEPGGIFAPNLTLAASFAGDNDMCVHYSFADVLRSSDIIFVFLGEKSLESLPLSFNKYDIKGKIFCHASPVFTSDVLDVNSYNTYTSFLLTSAVASDESHTDYGPLLLEGYGRKFDEFKNTLNLLGIEHSVITPEEKRLYLTAINFIRDYPVLIRDIGKKLLKYSLADVPDVHERILSMVSGRVGELTSYNALETGDENYLNHQKDLLNRLGIEPIDTLFRAIANFKEK